MVLVHGSDPLADGCAGLGDLGDGQWCEVFIVYVWLNLGNHLVWNMVLLGRRGGGGGGGGGGSIKEKKLIANNYNRCEDMGMHVQGVKNEMESLW